MTSIDSSDRIAGFANHRFRVLAICLAASIAIRIVNLAPLFSDSPDSLQLRADRVKHGGKKPGLSLDWTNLPVTTDLAKQIESLQNNCSLPVADHWFFDDVGMGSFLHVWSIGVCAALASNHRIQTRPPWLWMDIEACNATGHNFSGSPLTCYFPKSEQRCEVDTVDESLTAFMVDISVAGNCPNFPGFENRQAIRAAATEFLFSSLSPILVNEAERQVHKIFPGGVVPDDLITVHIRWGDKGAEVGLLALENFVSGVYSVLEQRGQPANATANIYLSSEDPRAVTQFKAAAPPEWTVYVDIYQDELLEYRNTSYNGNSFMSKSLNGKPGLIILGSLLIAMESRAFVLTTTSNWSRLMNELRKNVINPRCGNCTVLVDLSVGEW
jgi:hypothetical protein